MKTHIKNQNVCVCALEHINYTKLYNMDLKHTNLN